MQCLHKVKSAINKALSAYNAGNTEIISYRYCKSRGHNLITLNNVVDKAHIIANYNKFPVTFTVEFSDNMNSYYSEIEAFL